MAADGPLFLPLLFRRRRIEGAGDCNTCQTNYSASFRVYFILLAKEDETTPLAVTVQKSRYPNIALKTASEKSFLSLNPISPPSHFSCPSFLKAARNVLMKEWVARNAPRREVFLKTFTVRSNSGGREVTFLYGKIQ